MPVNELRSSPVTDDPYTEAAVLRANPNDPVAMAFYPDDPTSWTVSDIGLDGHTWVPALKPLVRRPGANGVKTIRKGEPKAQALQTHRAVVADRGGVELDYNDERFHVTDAAHLPPGAAPGSYLRQTPCTGGNFYHWVWDTPRQPLRGRGVTLEHDRAAFNRWRVSLVELGHIKPPSEEVKEAVISMARRRVQSATAGSQGASEDVRSARIGKAQARLDAALAAQVPTPKTFVEAPAETPAKRTAAKKGGQDE